MHVIWKRPDGFQNAQPEDFRRVSLSNGAHLWVHRFELDWYPFQVSGNWSGEQGTVKLNRLANLIDATQETWNQFINHCLDHDLHIDNSRPKSMELIEWIDELKQNIKGHTWELDIIMCSLTDIQTRLKSCVEP